MRYESGTMLRVGNRVVPMVEDYALTLKEYRGAPIEFVLRPRVKSRQPDDVCLKSLRGYYRDQLCPVVRLMRVMWIVSLLRSFVLDAAIGTAAGTWSL